MKYWETINPMSIKDVFRSPEITIGELKREKGITWVRAIMVKVLNSFIQVYSTTSTMNEIQVADTINLIMEEYPYYTLEDFKVFFKMVKKGYFGESYGRIDGPIILNWMRQYDMCRVQEAEEMSIEECNSYKGPPSTKKMNGCITYVEYQMLKKKADNGDKEDIGLLKTPA